MSSVLSLELIIDNRGVADRGLAVFGCFGCFGCGMSSFSSCVVVLLCSRHCQSGTTPHPTIRMSPTTKSWLGWSCSRFSNEMSPNVNYFRWYFVAIFLVILSSGDTVHFIHSCEKSVSKQQLSCLI